MARWNHLVESFSKTLVVLYYSYRHCATPNRFIFHDNIPMLLLVLLENQDVRSL